MKSLRCTFNPQSEVSDVILRLPLSKSEWIRQLFLCRMAGERLPALPEGAPSDVQVVYEALGSDMSGRIDVRDAGAAMRFLTAYVARFTSEEVRLFGTERMHARPIRPLVDALRLLGADIEYEGDEGFPPLLIRPSMMHGGVVHLDAGISSQYVTALLMIAPTLPGGLSIKMENEVVSAPYIEMTCRLLSEFGVEVDRTDLDITVREQPFVGAKGLSISADWSSASYIYSIVAVGKIRSRILLPGLVLPPDSLQADSRVVSLLGKLGVVTERTESGVAIHYEEERLIEDLGTVDVRDCPDLVPALAVCAMLKGVPFRLKGVGHLRLKESDRLAAICAEARRLGYICRDDDDWLIWDGGRCVAEEDPLIRVYNDHRLAMSFSVAAIVHDKGVTIERADVVGKSFPHFYRETRLLGLEWKEI